MKDFELIQIYNDKANVDLELFYRTREVGKTFKYIYGFTRIRTTTDQPVNTSDDLKREYKRSFYFKKEFKDEENTTNSDTPQR